MAFYLYLRVLVYMNHCLFASITLQLPADRYLPTLLSIALIFPATLLGVSQTYRMLFLSLNREFISDFDVMMMKKKEEMQKRRRKRKDYDLINDSDELIADMINKMKIAAEVCIQATYLIFD